MKGIAEGNTDGGSRWGVVLLLVGAGVVAAFQVGKAPAALPSLRAELGMGLVLSGWVISILNVVAVVGGTVAGAIADRLGHRRIMLAGLGLIAVANLAGGFASHSAEILIGRVAEGLGFLTIIVAVPSLLIDAAAPRDLKLAFGMWGCYMPIGAAIVILISPTLLVPYGWRGLWWANALIAGIYAVALAAGSRGIAGPRSPEASLPSNLWADIRCSMASRGSIALTLCFMAYSANWLAVLGFLPTFFVEERGMATTTTATLTALAVAVNAVGNLMGGVLMQRGMPRWRLIAFSHLAMALTSLILYSPAVPDLWRYVACLLFSMLSGVLPASVFSGVAAHSPSKRLIGTTNGLIVQGANLGQMVGPPVLAVLVGQFGGWQGSPIFVTTASVFGLACAIWLRGLEKTRRT